MGGLTAVVVNWNAGEHLVRCVEALLSGRDAAGLDVVVVDNASSDGSLAGLSRFGDRVRVIQTGGNLGFGRGVNRGVAASTAPYVMVLNPDVVLRPGAPERMVRFLEAEPAAGVVGPRLFGADGRVRASCGRPPELAHEICRRFLLHLIFPFLKFRRWIPSGVEAVGWVTGACFTVRREVFDAAGGMDEAFFMYYEDVDFCLRVHQAGRGVFFLPEAEGMHLGGASSGQALARMLVVSESSYRYFIRKHFGRRAAGLLSGLAPVEMALRSLLWAGLYFGRPGRRAEARARLRAYSRILRGRVGRDSTPGSSGRFAGVEEGV